MRPETVPLTKKYRFLLALSEERFRDIVVRPLLKRQGLRDGRDLCGPNEEGKDAAFFASNALGLEELWVVQTKKGKLNLARDATANIVEAVTQCKTALATRLTLLSPRRSLTPSRVILCASGTINKAAQKHIYDSVDDSRLIFLDADDLIPRIDDLYSELWLGIDPDVYPYLRAVKRSVEGASEALAVVDFIPAAGSGPVVTSEFYVPLRLYRTVLKVKRRGRRKERLPEVEEIPLTGILRRRERLILIQGDAGSGKSTALRRLAFDMASSSLARDNNHDFPILMRAGLVAEHRHATVVDLAERESCRLSGSAKTPFTVDDLARGGVTLLIDALDEVSDPGAREDVVNRLLALHSLYPRCLVVLTAREGDDIRLMPSLAGFERYSVSSISYSQAARIIDYVKQGKEMPVDERREILRRLQQVHGIQLNPLLVTVFAATSEYCGRDVPANITEMFKKYTEMMLGRWDASKGLAQQYQAPMKDFLLRQVAVTMHRRKTVKLSVEEFTHLVCDELERRDRPEEGETVCSELLARSGLLRVTQGEVEFRHLLLQEFFAGRGLSRGEIGGVVSDAWWRRAVVFFFGERPDDSAICEELRVWAESQSEAEKCQVALSLGLGIQACYLVEAGAKRAMLHWIIRTLAAAKSTFLQGVAWAEKIPVMTAVLYYLSGRESVGIVLNDRDLRELVEEWESSPDAGVADAETFWRIVALQEMGAIGQAVSLIRRWHPEDDRLLLGVLLGCIHIEELRIASGSEQETAKEIARKVRAKIPALIDAMLHEAKSMLLELRKGEVVAIGPDGSETGVGSEEVRALPR